MKLNRWFVGELAGYVSACLLAALVILAVSAVFLRYIAGAPLSWAEEIETLLLLWIILVGSVYAKRKNTLLRMDILYNLLPQGSRKFVDIAQECFHCLLFGVMIFYGYKMALHVGVKTLPLSGIHLFWLYMSLPVGAAGMLIVALIQLYCRVRDQEVE